MKIKLEEGTKIAIIGGGNLGTSIALGLHKSKYCKPQDIYITRRNETALVSLAKKKFNVTSDNKAAVRASKVVILAVKPFQIQAILSECKDCFNKDQIIISVITGVQIVDLLQMMPEGMTIYRAMPNTAIAIQQSMTCICSNNSNEEQNIFVTDLFSNLGKVALIQENLMDAATVLGACGTAFALRFIRASIQGGIEIGFDTATASLIAAQTAKGAAELLLVNGTHPEQEIDKVTTPKGCTIAGLNEMEHQGFSSSLIRGVAKSYEKIVKG